MEGRGVMILNLYPRPTKLERKRAEAERFLKLIDSTATYFSFQSFDDNKQRKDKRLARILHGTLAEHFDELTRLNAKGAGIFVCINETNGKGRAS
jgi:hypothetical protein